METDISAEELLQISNSEYQAAVDAAFDDDDQVKLYFLDAVRYPLLESWQDIMLSQLMERGRMIANATGIVNPSKGIPVFSDRVLEFIDHNPAQTFDLLGGTTAAAYDAAAHTLEYAALNKNVTPHQWSVDYTDEQLIALPISPLPVKELSVSGFADKPTDSLLMGMDMDRRLLTHQSQKSLLLRMLAGLETASTDSGLGERMVQEVIAANTARDYIAKANTRMVISLAKRKLSTGMPFLDLIQEGNIGLLTGIDKFNYRFGNKASTYIHWWIWQKIGRGVVDKSDVIRRPIQRHDELRYFLNLSRALQQESGSRPSLEELAQAGTKYKRSAAEVGELIQFTQPVSLERPVGEDGDSEFGDLIDSGEDTEKTVMDTMRREAVLAYVNEIVTDDRNKRILLRRFGLDDTHPASFGEGMTLEELALEEGVSRERIRQIEKEALRKMRNPVKIRKIKAYKE